MGLFSFTKSSLDNNFPTTQVEQRSHDSLNLPGSDISHTLEKITESSTAPPKIVAVTSEGSLESVGEFVSSRPNNNFIIDGERDVKQSIICTENGKGGKTCLKLGVNSVDLFKAMQGLEYFCSLPDDIDATYFECRKIK